MIGAAPMAAAAANRTADPILAEAIAGSTTALDVPAPDFQLTDQNGRDVSLTSLRGKVVLMTFLDPVCSTECPVIGAEFRQAAVQLGQAEKQVELVAVVANPAYRSIAVMRAFDAEEVLTSVPNWLYLTGSLGALQKSGSNSALRCRTCRQGRCPCTPISPSSSTGTARSAPNSMTIPVRAQPALSPRSRPCWQTMPGKPWRIREPGREGLDVEGAPK